MVKLDPPIIDHLDSGVPGARSTIMVGVHGNEKVGPMILDWIKSIEITAGELVIIVANPTALECNERYVNVNLNRRIAKGANEYPEDDLAVTIRAELDRADALLDIHSYNEPMDRPFIITDGMGLEIAKFLPADYVVTGWSKPGQAAAGDDYMVHKDKIGICFECGSSDRPKDYIDTAKHAVLTFLKQMGHITDYEVILHKEQKVLRMIGPVKQTLDSVEFDQDYTTFDALKSGAVFACQGTTEHIADDGQYIIFPRPKANPGDEAFYLSESL
ncbi:MAG: succinylglutamate desuccinylase/aspartoacylase family protein [Patescibacteria group bacterium]